jgi:hypothetical protein
MAEGIAADDFGGARTRQIDIDHALDPPGPIGHHHDAIGELDRFCNVVGNQHRRLLQLLLNLQHLVTEQKPRLFIQRRERLVHQKDFRLGCERAGERNALAHATGQFVRITVFEAVEPNHVDEVARFLVALRLAHAFDLERKGDILDHRAPGEC